MKISLSIIAVTFVGLTFALGPVKAKPAVASLNTDEEKIEWLDFESAIDKNDEDKKFIFIDIYTGWCGWCKKMDQTTFEDKEVVKYINEHFYAVKMDAESKEAIAYKEVLYEYKTYPGGKGYNELAVQLMDGKMSFPTFVVLSKREVKLGNIRGYQKPDQLLDHLEAYTKKKRD